MIGYPSSDSFRAAAAQRAARWVAWVELGPRHLLIAAVLLSSLALLVRPVTDPDYWYHVRVGRWIVEHGHLPGQDLFTYTVGDHRWVDHEYLTEVLMSLLNARLGMAGVSMLFGALTWCGLLLVWMAARTESRSYVLGGLAVALGAIAGAPVWGPRPQMVTFFLVCLELFWLRRHAEGTSRAIRWLPLVMVAWSSLHGGWPIAFVLLAAAAAAEAGSWLADRSNREAIVRLRRLLLVGIASLAAVGLNPNGPAVYLYPFQTLASSAQQDLISEWQSPDFHLPALRALEVMMLLLVAGFALGGWRRRNLRAGAVFDLLVVLIAVALTLSSVRHLSLFVAAATPVLAATWDRALAGYGLPVRAGDHGPGRRRAVMSAISALVLLIVAGLTAGRIATSLRGQAELTGREYPVGASAWLAAHPTTGTRMFNEYSWGGYLADRFYPAPDRRVFIFGEAALMGDAQIRRYYAIQNVSPDWRRALDEARVDYVVDRPDAPLSGALASDADWRLVYRDGTAVVFVRAGSSTAHPAAYRRGAA